VELFHADRIGHGTAAGKDPDLMDLLAAKEVCVEVCPISNRLAAAMAEGLSICDMQQQYEVAKHFSFMEGLK